MHPNIHLIIHNVLSIISAVVLFGTAVFTYLNGPKKTTNIMIALSLMTAVVFYISNTIGVSVSDPVLSKHILMFNLCIFLSGIFQVHAYASFTGLAEKNRRFIIFIYAAGLACIALFLVFPDLFLLPSVPKMYFPNYYNPGILNWTRIAFFIGVIIPYCIYILERARKQSTVALERAQYGYLIWAVLIIHVVLFIPNFLVYDIPVDPIWGTLAGIAFSIPFGYAAFKFELFDIRVIAKQAFFYSCAVGGIGALITLLNYGRDIIAAQYPSFPIWTLYLLSSLLAVTMGLFVWRKLRESDLLKYEFITTVTHKFRTPLTHIKWAAENLAKAQSLDEIKEQVGYIAEADSKLVELTNLLVNVSTTESTEAEYHLQRDSMSDAAGEVIIAVEGSKARNVAIVKDIDPDVYGLFDRARIKFIIQTLLENGINYSPEGTSVKISVKRDGAEVRCSVTDAGIGIPKEELPRIFAKFYRSKDAQLADTEGMGIGLFVSRQIISKHNGKIWAESEGAGKGSTFSFTIPAA